MQKLKLLLCAAFLIAASSVFGQAEKTVSLIKEGSKLTDGDIGFLSMVAGEKVEAGKKRPPGYYQRRYLQAGNDPFQDRCYQHQCGYRSFPEVL